MDQMDELRKKDERIADLLRSNNDYLHRARRAEWRIKLIEELVGGDFHFYSIPTNALRKALTRKFPEGL